MNRELSDVYYTMLGRLYDVEDQLVRHIPKMIENTTNEDLRDALEAHLGETEEQRSRLQTILGRSTETMNMERDEAFEKMLDDAEQQMTNITNGAVRDAFIIAAGQTVEHLEMAKYGTLMRFAEELEDTEAYNLLAASLGEEQAADKKLTRVAEGGMFTIGVNREAAEAKEEV